MSYKNTLKPGEPALTTELVGRRIAYPFALLAKKLGLSANTVTIIAGLCWMLSLPLPFLAGLAYLSLNTTLSVSLWLTAGFLWNAGYIFDIADGSLARMTGTSSKRGFYLDYVFHLLFKPAFLASVGLGVFFMAGNGSNFLFVMIFVLSLFSIPANWSATQSAVDYVLSDTTGKNRDKIPGTSLGEKDFRRLWLGSSDMIESAAEKRSAPVRFLKTCVQEVFSYYGQFTFFSITVLVDMVYLHFCDKTIFLNRLIAMPITTFFFIFITVILIIRVPFRIYRDYKRIALADKESG